MTGEKTSVHKPLLSAGDVADKGHSLWLDGNVGYIIQKQAVDASPKEMEVDESGHRASGGLRLVNP